MRRRSFLTAAGAAAAAGLALKSARDHDEAALRADVFVTIRKRGVTPVKSRT
jgi:hypothetical protein